ncbi:MAG TPA: hypothetical protein VFF73_32855 [Planctomycetota bacterium]|nr:hypothetical protein [Planctomycetota bacterium]
MDEHLETLKRALREDPSDLSSALKLAAALEKTGRFDEAWELLEPRDAPQALAGLASRNPVAVLERLRKLDYTRSRLLMERLVVLGLPRHPSLVFLACQAGEDQVLRRQATQVLERALNTTVSPEELRHFLDTRDTAIDPPMANAYVQEKRAAARSFMTRFLERAGKAPSVALLPWLVALITSRDPELAAKALDMVRRMTGSEGPPFDAELLARLLERNEGEAA